MSPSKSATTLKNITVPDEIGGFHVLEPIAKGGMSCVYRGRDPSCNLDVAIKLITKEHSEAYDHRDEKNRRQWAGYKFLKGIRWEGEILSNLNHPHIIQLYEHGRENGQYYIIMQHLDSRSLQELSYAKSSILKGRRLKVVFQFAHALLHVHRMGIIHRDICPRNVLLDENGRAILIDFGLSVPKLERLKDVFYRSGTPSYMAPELIRSNKYDFRTDIYAFGVSMYEMFTGRPAYVGEDGFDRAAQHLNVEVKPAGEVNPNIPRALESIIMRALEKSPNRRYQSMENVVKDLGRLVGAANPSESTRILLQNDTRRMYERIRDCCYLHYYVRSWISKGQKEVAITENISRGGVSFKVRNAPPQGATLNLEIQPRAATNRISATAKVAHIGEADPKGLYTIGVEFVKIASKDQDRFDKYIQERRTAELPAIED